MEQFRYSPNGHPRQKEQNPNQETPSLEEQIQKMLKENESLDENKLEDFIKLISKGLKTVLNFFRTSDLKSDVHIIKESVFFETIKKYSDDEIKLYFKTISKYYNLDFYEKEEVCILVSNYSAFKKENITSEKEDYLFILSSEGTIAITTNQYFEKNIKPQYKRSK